MKIDTAMLKRLRSEKQWSQEQLAELCGLNLRTIQRLEKSGSASTESVRALAAVFGVAAKELIIDSTEVKLKPFESVKASLLAFDDFKGKAGRYEFWWFFLIMLLVFGIAEAIHPKAYRVVAIILLIPFLAVGSRRLRDAGHSPWWQWMYFVPFGIVVPLFLKTYESSDTRAKVEEERDTLAS